MNYEEKYNEALERAQKVTRAGGDVAVVIVQNIFPELRESEDERMLKEFNDYLCEEIEARINDLRDEKDRMTLNMLCYVLKKVDAWLKKQKEQKPVEIDKEINRWMGCEAFPEGINITPLPQAMEIVERTAKHFFELGEKTVPSPGGYWEGFKHGVRECQDKIRDVKDTMKEQKQEWSEEDEDMLKHIISDLREFRDCETDEEIISDYEDEISWLKSLRPQWRPSGEQIGALNYAYCELFKRGDVGHNILGSLQKLIDQLREQM